MTRRRRAPGSLNAGRGRQKRPTSVGRASRAAPGSGKANTQGNRNGFSLGYQHGHWQGLCEATIARASQVHEKRPFKVLYVTSGKGYPYSPLDEGIHHSLLEVADSVILASPKDDAASVAEAQRPDLVLVLDGMDFPAAQVDRIRGLGIRTAIWFTDDPYYTDITSALAPHYDRVFTLERNCVPYYQSLGCARVHNLPLAVYPGYYRTRNPRMALRGDVAFIGTAYWNRVKLFHELLPRLESKRFRLSGLWWDRLPDYDRWRSRIDLGKWMTPIDTAECYNANRIVINVHRAHDDETFNRNSAGIPAVSPNPRTFEIAACGTLQIVDGRDDLAQYYEPGREIVTYDSPGQLADLIDYYLTHEEERQQIALRALYRTMRDHSFASRLTQLIDLAMEP
ncbi:spore maturation protein cgeB [Cohnella fermenti]|uniref:Spore maturation protein cgeB n=2 Tax=Cohnella fermenti TaxID=2565925 RepID=A0A4S4BGL4_9BACL|nr:spore maturation protein cgeB [Cohnella fermenti]